MTALTFKGLRWPCFYPAHHPRLRPQRLACSRADTAPRLGNPQQPAQSQEAVAWAGASLGTQECGWKVLRVTKNHFHHCCWHGPCCGADDEEGWRPMMGGGVHISLLKRAAPRAPTSFHLGLWGGRGVGSFAWTLKVSVSRAAGLG